VISAKSHRPGITEDTPDPGPGNEAGEPVQVLESLDFGQRDSKTRISPEGKSGFPEKSRSFLGY
jgi:hypothetical protein